MPSTDWQNQKNPDTGRPFGSYDEWNNYQYGLGQKKAATAFVTSGDTATVSANDPWANWDWTLSRGAGTTVENGGQNPNGNTWTSPLGTIGFQTGQGDGQPQFGYIDPHTGKITFQSTNYTAPKYSAFSSTPGSMTKSDVGSTQYHPGQDYGLGPENLGIIPIEHDVYGNPVKFYAATYGGGGMEFTDLAQAQASIAAYNKWYKEQNPTTFQKNPGSSNTGTTTPTTTTGTQTKGLLTDPGVAETTFDSTKDFYDKGPVRAAQAFSDKPTQPTDTEQYWNAMNGKYQTPNTAESDMWDQWKGEFASPEALKGVYQRGQDAAQRTLDRKSASAGWGDSGAAARATGNIGQQFTDAFVRAEQDFAKTGMGLAASADTSQDTKVKTGAGLAKLSDDSRATQTKSWLDTVNTAQGIDSADLAYKTGKQAAANSAQAAKEGRLGAEYDRSMQIAQNMSMLTSSGLNAASSQTMAYNMADLQMQLAKGNMTYAQSEAKLKEYAAAMGVTGKSLVALLSNWKQQNDWAGWGDTTSNGSITADGVKYDSGTTTINGTKYPTETVNY